jgi:signal transduction histidine kinase
MKSQQENFRIRNAQLEKDLAQKIRELEIEAALEQVRSRSLAMHQTEELREVVSVVFEKLHELGIVMDEEAASIVIFTEGTKDLILWNAIPDQLYSKSFHIPYYDTTVISSLLDARNARADFFKKNYTPQEKDHFWKWAVECSDYKNIPADRKKHILESKHFACSVAFTKNSAMLLSSYNGKLLSEEESKILKRFARVFEQAYVRFLDLHKAEEQAHEAQIELSLERVRAKTMAMHNSEDVGDTVAAMFDELVKLGVEKTVRCGILIIDETKHMEVWTAAYNPDGKVDMLIGRIDMMIHPLISGIHQAWKNKEQIKSYELAGEDLTAYYQAVNNSPEYPVQFDLASLPSKQSNNAFFFPEGAIFAFTLEPLSADTSKLFKRFAGVFGLTYRRYLDLQKAEAQAREAKIEAALERVRSRTLAMQKSDELAQTAVVVFKQLIGLGIQPNRLFIGIIKDDSGDIELWATDEDGSKISTRFTGNINRNQSIKKMYNGWNAHKKSLTIDMHGKELKDYFDYLSNELKVPFKLGLSQKRRVQLIAYFSQGFIGMASPEQQPEETTSLLERFAGVFNLTYTRFNDLKIAEMHAVQAEQDLVKLQTEKKRAEDALTELQAAQRQLVQSEKMASLGELTAGIAHEIQNPLNFVNNFSEVNQEMIDELEEELKSGNIDEAMALIANIKQNEEKINHHGKRADFIVKGMLQHSRISTGEKQPTNLDLLADEFLKLSFHGLRAKDKFFNAEMVTNFDANLPKINVVQQDIGRVLLNLYNNAFYAVNKKAKTSSPDYKPTVEVSTLANNGYIEIKVKDNGNGIPENIREKIMQPFFTTKPTGEGTGLGLSLTYDMVVKGHAGSIQVNSEEGEGSEFIVKLPLN